MGIPFYFKHLIRNHPDIIKCPGSIKRCRRMFLDFNCMLHQSAQRVLAANPLNDNTDALDRLIIQDALDYIVKIINVILPSELLFIAVDGLCPRAKMNQQRKRRYVSAWRTGVLQKDVNIPISRWDSNTITPGTAFMAKLDAALIDFQERNNAKKRSHGSIGFNIIVSPSTEFGEGEHKIYDYIRNEHNNHEGNDHCYDVIYGLDADLILLSMISVNSERIVLLREKPAFNIPFQTKEDFLILDISRLMHSLLGHFDEHKYPTEFIRDYVMLCSLVGNDFIPPLSYLRINERGIDIIVRAYKIAREKIPGTFLIQHGSNTRINTDLTMSNNTDTITTAMNNDQYEVNLMCLLQIFKELATLEDNMMADACDQYYNKTYRADRSRCGTAVERRMNELDNYPTLNKFPNVIHPRIEGWRLDYYQHLCKANTLQDINQIIDNYIQGLFWIVEYYFNHNASKTWYYRYNYSPTLFDLQQRLNLLSHDAKTLQQLQQISIINDDYFSYIKYNPMMQLLMVLPIQSSHLLDKAARSLMENIQNGSVHVFPHQFKLSTFLKMYLWECSPLLPDIDVDYLYKCYTRAISQN
jgi:5'-3' exonuclease